jgi:hypothetical protein
MPAKRARKCAACQQEAPELLRFTTYGSLCQECFRLATQMEALIHKYESSSCPEASNVLRRQIHLQLRRLARRLQQRMAIKDDEKRRSEITETLYKDKKASLQT